MIYNLGRATKHMKKFMKYGMPEVILWKYSDGFIHWTYDRYRVKSGIRTSYRITDSFNKVDCEILNKSIQRYIRKHNLKHVPEGEKIGTLICSNKGLEFKWGEV